MSNKNSSQNGTTTIRKRYIEEEITKLHEIVAEFSLPVWKEIMHIYNEWAGSKGYATRTEEALKSIIKREHQKKKNSLSTTTTATSSSSSIVDDNENIEKSTGAAIITLENNPELMEDVNKEEDVDFLLSDIASTSVAAPMSSSTTAVVGYQSIVSSSSLPPHTIDTNLSVACPPESTTLLENLKRSHSSSPSLIEYGATEYEKEDDEKKELATKKAKKAADDDLVVINVPDDIETYVQQQQQQNKIHDIDHPDVIEIIAITNEKGDTRWFDVPPPQLIELIEKRHIDISKIRGAVITRGCLLVEVDKTTDAINIVESSPIQPIVVTNIVNSPSVQQPVININATNIVNPIVETVTAAAAIDTTNIVNGPPVQQPVVAATISDITNSLVQQPTVVSNNAINIVNSPSIQPVIATISDTINSLVQPTVVTNAINNPPIQPAIATDNTVNTANSTIESQSFTAVIATISRCFTELSTELNTILQNLNKKH